MATTPTRAQPATTLPTPVEVKAATQLLGLGRQRLALVVGLSRVGDVDMPAVRRDAASVAEALRRNGFLVMARPDLGIEDLRRSLAEFRQRLNPNGAGLIYVAGAGARLDGRSWLITRSLPAGDAAPKADVLKASAMPVDELILALQITPSSLRVLVVDGATPLPNLPTDWHGLVAPTMPDGVMALLSAQPGKTMPRWLPPPLPSPPPQDPRETTGSPFGTAFVHALLSAGYTGPQILLETRRLVMDATAQTVTPWLGGRTDDQDELGAPTLPIAHWPEAAAQQAMAVLGGQAWDELRRSARPAQAPSAQTTPQTAPSTPPPSAATTTGSNATPAAANRTASALSAGEVGAAAVGAAQAGAAVLGAAQAGAAALAQVEAAKIAAAQVVATQAAGVAAGAVSVVAAAAQAIGGSDAAPASTALSRPVAGPSAAPAGSTGGSAAPAPGAPAAAATPLAPAAVSAAPSLAASAPSSGAPATTPAPASAAPLAASPAASAPVGAGAEPPSDPASAPSGQPAGTPAQSPNAPPPETPQGPTGQTPPTPPTPPGPPPMNPYGYAVGDSFTYRRTDLWKGESVGLVMQVVEALEANGDLLGREGSDAVTLDPQGRVRNRRGPSGSETFTPAELFWWAKPKVGESRDISFDETFESRDGRGERRWEGEVEVGDPTRITTSAGTFNVLPMEGEGWVREWRMPQRTRIDIQWERTVWYSPDLGHPVAIDIVERDASNRLLRKERLELVHQDTSRSVTR